MLDRWTTPAEGVPVDVETARRIAVRAQGLDGTQTDVLETVRRLGFLQLDPISTVAPPQQLVLWSRLGALDASELDRLLWEERKLVEWNAFLYPIETLPILKAFMGRTDRRMDVRRRAFLRENSTFSRYVLKELRERGPLLSREIETHSSRVGADRSDWWGVRQMGLMLEVLAEVGKVAVVGRRGKQRVWDLAERWYPPMPKLSLKEAIATYEDQRVRAIGVRLERGRLVAHPEAVDGPVPDRITFLSPFDRLIHARDRTEAMWNFYYRLEMYVPEPKREYGYYVLPILRGDKLVGRIEPLFDRKENVLRVKGLWWEKGVRSFSLEKPLKSLAKFLGAERIDATPPTSASRARR
jgi:uncharacterized protein YcaQ